MAERAGRQPVVVDAADLVRNPEGTVKAYCAATGIPFIRGALSWQPPQRPEWQPSHESVAASTGFGAVCSEAATVADAVAERYLRRHLPHYEALHARRLTPA